MAKIIIIEDEASIRNVLKNILDVMVGFPWDIIYH